MRLSTSPLLLILTSALGASALAQQGGPLEPPPAPDGNPVTVPKANLGKALFWEEQLSSTRTVACGTCHVPAAGGADPRALRGAIGSTHPGPDSVIGTQDDIIGAAGVPSTQADGSYAPAPLFGLHPQVTSRLSAPATDAGYARSLFWDGRADDVLVDPVTGATVLASGAALENQALAPILSPIEMGHVGRTWDEVIARVEAITPLAIASDVPLVLSDWIAGRDYPQLFEEAFGDEAVTAPRIAMAIATYERTLVGNQTPLDLELSGVPSLTDQERRGLALFNSSRTDCSFCHIGNRLTNDLFQNIGVRPNAEDLGRYQVTGFDDDRARFKTPSLRNAALRGAFMHNGAFASLSEVVDFYDRGGAFHPPNRDPLIRPLGLSPAEKADLVAFLGRPLTDPRIAAELPPFDRPKLYTETAGVPLGFGGATPGVGGRLPSARALEPPSIENSGMTLALANGRQGALAFLAVDTLADPDGLLLGGVTIHLGLTPELAILPVGPLQGPGPGHASVTFDLSASPALLGTTWTHQWFVLDPAATAGTVAASAGVSMTIF